MTQLFGIDIGGSGIKGAPVDLDAGELAGDRYRIKTPKPATPEAVADVVAEIVNHFDYQGPIGAGFPAIVHNGVTKSAANVDDSWIDYDAQSLLSEVTGQPVLLLNDADVAGIAEMAYGAGRGQMGTVIIVTIGTGIGTALFRRGILVPNTELGHIEIRGKDAERRSSEAAKKRKGWSWKKWSKRFDEHLRALEFLFSPDLFILGGGGSKKWDKFAHRLTVKAEVVPAELRNEAGIIGAALAAQELRDQPQ